MNSRAVSKELSVKVASGESQESSGQTLSEKAIVSCEIINPASLIPKPIRRDYEGPLLPPLRKLYGHLEHRGKHENLDVKLEKLPR
jgi:hypothetical protein